MISRLLQRAAAIGALLLIAATSLPTAGSVHAQEKPLEIIFQNLKEGDTIGEKPFVIQMCFSRPINIKDKDKGGDFDYSLTTNQGMGLGLRIVFQPDGWGVSVYPGPEASVSGLPSPKDNNWTWAWRAVAADDKAVNEGSFEFAVDEDAEPIPQETPPVCVAGGNTATPVPTFDTPTPSGGTSATPTGSAGPSPTGEPDGSVTPTPEPAGEDSGDGPDILPLALLTIGGAGGLALLALIGYLVRRKVGFELHAPTGESGGEHGDHH